MTIEKKLPKDQLIVKIGKEVNKIHMDDYSNSKLAKEEK